MKKKKRIIAGDCVDSTKYDPSSNNAEITNTLLIQEISWLDLFFGAPFTRGNHDYSMGITRKKRKK